MVIVHRPGPRPALLRLSLSLFFLAAPGAAGPLASPAGAAQEAVPPVSRARYLMGTICRGHVLPGPTGVPGPEEAAAALESAFDEIARLEAVLSDYRPDSELSRLGAAGPQTSFACSADLFDFLSRAVDLSRATSGAFDITVAPLVAVWDLRGAGREAADAEVREALDRVGWQRLRLDAADRTARLERPGMKLDPGAIGKGYALDAAVRVLRSRGISRALLDFGGQIKAVGAPEGQPGWEVAIADPRRRNEPALAVWLRDASLSTSGNDQKGIMVNGRLLGHVLDPRTGRPVITRGNVSVISPDATTADALSTALLVMGSDQGLRWLERRPDVQAVFLDVDERGGIRAGSTPGFASINVTSGHSAAPSLSSDEDPR